MTVVETHEGLRERKKAKTRRALEDTALKLFRKHGFERTTVEQIADACDVSPRTFFRYFPTKEDVLFGDAQVNFETLVAALAARPADETPLQALRFAALTMGAMQEGERERRKIRNEIVAATPSLRARGSERQDLWNEAATQLLMRRAGTADGEPTLEIRLVVGASSAATRVAFQAWTADSSTDLVELINDAFDRLAAGLRG